MRIEVPPRIVPTEPTPSTADPQLGIIRDGRQPRIYTGEISLRLIRGVEFTPSSSIPPGAVLPLAQSLATAGPNHSDIDPIHIPEISVRTCQLHMPHKTLARDRRC